MNYILFDGAVRNALLPFTYTRPVADIRIGILTIREKWEKYLSLTTTTITEEYLEEKYPMVEMAENILINASFCPTKSLVEKVKTLSKNEAIFKGDDVIAFFTTETQEEVNFEDYTQVEFEEELIQVKNTWDIFSRNAEAIQQDFELLTEGRKSQPIPVGVQCIQKENIFIEEGAKPYCKVGGEVNNAVLFGYSNKGHDGFLGNSVLGEWCNLGADTNNSNLKNNYAEVRLWDYESGRFAKTGLQFCGLMMGDHSKCGINTMFNTGTVIGVSANIFGSGFPRNFVPSFSWGGASGFTEYKLNKVFEVAKMVMKRRNIVFDEQEQRILEHVFEESQQFRNY